MFKVAIKSGTCGWHDYDNCDQVIIDIPSDNIPRVGEVLEINDLDNKKYLVTEVKRVYLIPNETSTYEFGEWIYVYVISVN